jgi:hypothetical protein
MGMTCVLLFGLLCVLHCRALEDAVPLHPISMRRKGTSSDVFFVVLSCLLVLFVALISCQRRTHCSENDERVKLDGDTCAHSLVEVRKCRSL